MIDAEKYKKLYLILQDISNAIVIHDRIVPLTDYLLDVAIKYVNAESGSLMLVNERGALTILSSQGLDAAYISSFGSQGGDAISSTILRKQEPMLVHDITQHPELCSQDRHHYKTRSFISCPIMFRNRPLGIINVNDKKDGMPFTHSEMELLQIVANNAAVALENASLLNRLKAAAADLEQVNGRLIDSDIAKTEFLTIISHELRTPLNAIKGAVYYLDNHDAVSPNERREFHGIISTETGNLASVIDNLIRFLEVEDESLMLDKSRINIADILNSLPSGQLESALSTRSIRLTVAPLPGPLWIVGDRLRVHQVFSNLLIGLSHYLMPDDVMDISASSEKDLLSIRISLSRPLPQTILQQLNHNTSLRPTASTDDRVRIYLARNSAIAHRWSIAAENDTSTSRITVSCPLSSNETLNVYINKSISLFVDYISDSLDIDICSVMLSDELSGELRVASARGLDDKVVKATRIKQGDKIAGWVALEGKPLFINDIENDARFSRKSIPQYNNKSLMSFPIKVDDRVIGVLNLNNKKSSQPFSQQDYERALALVDSFSEHLRNAYSKHLSEAEIFQLISSMDSTFSFPASSRKPPH
jgi:hypothetical protein